jgi:hypothetical protein
MPNGAPDENTSPFSVIVFDLRLAGATVVLEEEGVEVEKPAAVGVVGALE